MKRQDFAYDLPENLIASIPLEKRSNARLMIVDPGKPIEHRKVSELSDLIQSGDIVVANNTQVFPARLFGTKESGGRIEVLIERLLSEETFRAFIKASKAPKKSAILFMDGGFELNVDGRDDELFLLSTRLGAPILEMAEAHGHIPLPPYIKRQDTESDRERYQTIFAKKTGAVAAPTAGLHIDQDLIKRIKAKGAEWCEITLHVGAGTFNPVRVDDLAEHRMHDEWYNIPEEVATLICRAKISGQRVIAIGTTTMRCLESSAQLNEGRVTAGSDETSIFISPGYRFNVIDMLFTNFHLPESTLLMLVSAFGGYECMMTAYKEAINKQYRFFSYGDACLINHNFRGSDAR